MWPHDDQEGFPHDDLNEDAATSGLNEELGSNPLKLLQKVVSHKLEEIAKLLPKAYRLTLIARHTGTEFDDADIVLTDDDLGKAEAAINRMRRHNA